MGTIAEKIAYLAETKQAIKQAIIDKGVEIASTDTFRSYADKISEISSGSSRIYLAKFDFNDNKDSIASSTLVVSGGTIEDGQLKISSTSTQATINLTASSDILRHRNSVVVEFKVYIDQFSTNGWAEVISLYNSGSDLVWFLLNSNNNFEIGGYFSGTVVDKSGASGVTISGNWVTVKVIFTDSPRQYQIYFNGTLTSTVSSSQNFPAVSNIRFNSSSTTYRPLCRFEYFHIYTLGM